MARARLERVVNLSLSEEEAAFLSNVLQETDPEAHDVDQGMVDGLIDALDEVL